MTAIKKTPFNLRFVIDNLAAAKTSYGNLFCINVPFETERARVCIIADVLIFNTLYCLSLYSTVTEDARKE